MLLVCACFCSKFVLLFFVGLGGRCVMRAFHVEDTCLQMWHLIRVPPFVHVSALIGHTNGYLVRCGVSRVAMLAAERFFAASCVLVGLVS